MVQTKKESRKAVFTPICFYGSAKIEQKIKVCVRENKGFVAKKIKMRGNNPMQTSKLYILLNILAPCWWDFHKISIMGIFDDPMLTSKLLFC